MTGVLCTVYGAQVYLNNGHSQGHLPWNHVEMFYWLSTHAKYEISMSYDSNFMDKVKAFYQDTQTW